MKINIRLNYKLIGLEPEIKKKIIYNLYGVDINARAVEITQLRIWLWLVESYLSDNIKPLPNLDCNIRVGNSLFGFKDINKFTKNHIQTNLLEEVKEDIQQLIKEYHTIKLNYKLSSGVEAKKLKKSYTSIKEQIKNYLDKNFYQSLKMQKIEINENDFEILKVFHWGLEFDEIFSLEKDEKERGFDIVIGNPPYVRQEELSEIKPYLQKNYEIYHGMADLFVYFFEREIKLLKEGGYFGMIVSNKWLRAGYGVNLRRFLSKFWIETFIDFGDLKVFPEATIYPCIIIIRKINKQNPEINVCKIDTLNFDSLDEHIKSKQFIINQKEFGENEWKLQTDKENIILKKITSQGVELENYLKSKIYRGIVTGLNDAFIIDETTKKQLLECHPRNSEIIKPILIGSEIKRYRITTKNKYLIFTKRGTDIDKYPEIKKHLKKYETDLTPKNSSVQTIGRKPGDYKWYEIQDITAYYKEFEKDKIIWGNLAKRSSFYFDESGFYVNAPACILPTSSKYILGILNSKLISYFLKSTCAERQGGFIEQKPVYVSKIPIKKPTLSEEEIIKKLVDRMLSLNKRLKEIGDKKTSESAKIEEEIKKIDNEIDNLVYILYGLTKDEIAIVEESLK